MDKLLRSIRLRLALFFVLVTTLTLGAFGLLSRHQLSNNLERQFNDLKRDVVTRLKITLPVPLWNFDIAAMEQIVASEAGPQEVQAIFVQDSRAYNVVGIIKQADGKFLPTLEPGAATGEPVTHPIYRPDANKEPIGEGESAKADGYVVVHFSREPIKQALGSNLRNLAMQILVVNVLLLIFLTLGLRLVFRPLAHLRDALHALARQDSPEMSPLAASHLTELDALTEGFNQTMAKLKRVIEMHTAAEAEAVAATRETRQVLEKLVAAQEELVKAGKLAALGRLVAGISHELNTPIGNGLMAVSALLDQLTQLKTEMREKGPRRSTLESFLENAENGMALTLNSLSRSASLVSRFKQVAVDRNQAHFADFDVDQLIRHVLEKMTEQLTAAECRIDYEADERLTISSDFELLGQVVATLISNAIVHGFQGRVGGSIRLQAKRGSAGRAVITIRDDGVGIPAADLPKVFDPFFTTRLGKGESGLGLYIANNVVTDVLGGRLSMSSVVGEGTECAIAIPLAELVEHS